MNEIFFEPKDLDKAGYNQAGRISEVLSILRNTFLGATIQTPNNFSQALEACRGTLNVISGKVSQEKIDDIDKIIYALDNKIDNANETYFNDLQKAKYFKNPNIRKEVKKELENLWRKLEKLQDEYGYGMMSEEEIGL